MCGFGADLGLQCGKVRMTVPSLDMKSYQHSQLIRQSKERKILDRPRKRTIAYKYLQFAEGESHM